MSTKSYRVTPQTMNERKRDFKQTIMENYGNDGEFWVTLIPLPETAAKNYLTAKDTIMKNILKLSDSEEEETDEEMINFNSKGAVALGDETF